MLKIWKVFSFSAAHSVASLPEGHKCRNVHGHNYRVRVCLSAPLDVASGMCGAIEFDKIKAAWSEIEPGLDHRSTNEILGANATVEHLAIYIYGQMKHRIGHVCKVEVWESDTCGAEFSD